MSITKARYYVGVCVVATYCLLSLYGGSTISAQSFYSKDLDQNAQQALNLANQVTSSNVFSTEIKNLAILSDQDFATYFLQKQRALRANVDNLAEGSWNDLNRATDRINATVLNPNRLTPDSLAVATGEVTAKMDALQKQIQVLKATAEAQGLPSIPLVLENITNVTQFEGIIGKVGANTNTAALLKRIGAAIDQFGGLIKDYNDAIKSIHEQTASIADLRSPLLQLALQRLQIQADHIKTVAAIWDRNQRDLEEVNALYSSYTNRMARLAKSGIGLSGQTIDAGIQIANGMALGGQHNATPLEDLFLALHEATALFARGDMPTQLASLRQAQEEQLYSIRLDAATARIYETLLTTGTKRLSMYYQSGVKAETIAHIIQTAATIAIPATIALK